MSAEPATYTDILYTERPDGVAFITINRPDRYNAFAGGLLRSSSMPSSGQAGTETSA